MQLRDLIRILWIGIQGAIKLIILGLCLPWVVLRTVWKVESDRKKDRIPPQVNVSDPAVAAAERVVEDHLEHLKRGKRRMKNGEV